MAVATVTLNPTVATGFVTGKYVCDSSPSLTYINIGFRPSRVEVVNATDGDQFALWTREMADGTCVKTVNGGSPTKVASGGITPVTHADGTNYGFSVGTDSSVQEASKTWSFIAFRA